MNKKYMLEKLMDYLQDEEKVTGICSILEECERNEHRQKQECQKKGIQKAKAKGVTFGRPRIKEPDNFEMIYYQYMNKEITAGAAARLCSMALSTFYRRGREFEEKTLSEMKEEGEQ